jgi:hypothetical protein
MKKVLLATSLVLLGAGTAIALGPSAAHAANAGNPYGNVDHRNDAGNDTGNSRVDDLNAQQLNKNYKGPLEPRPPSGTGMAMPTPQPQMVVPAQPGAGAPSPVIITR